MTVRSQAGVEIDVAGPVEYRVLGPVQMRVGGQPLLLGGSKPYGLLTLLLLTPGQAVSTPRLIAGLWGDPEPRTAAKMLQVYVSRIRQRMADSAMPGRLRTTPIGYALDVQTGELDLSSFESLTSLGRLTGPSDPAAAARLFAQALALWNGEALANVLSEPFAEAEAARLNGLRLSTLEARVDADIAAGSGPELVEELQHLVRANPTREHMAAQLMLTLYRAGRQAEALQVSRTLRTHLDDELGLAPGPEVQRIELAILRHDHDLDRQPIQTRPIQTQPIAGAAPTRPVPTSRTWRSETVTESSRSRIRIVAWAAATASLSLVAWLALPDLRSPDRVAGQPAEPTGVAVAADSLVVVDGATETVRLDVHLGGRPTTVATSGTTAWVGNTTLRTVSRVDLHTGATTEKLRAAGTSCRRGRDAARRLDRGCLRRDRDPRAPGQSGYDRAVLPRWAAHRPRCACGRRARAVRRATRWPLGDPAHWKPGAYRLHPSARSCGDARSVRKPPVRHLLPVSDS